MHADKASAGCWSLLPNEWATGRGYTQVSFATGDDAVDFYRSCGWADEESLTRLHRNDDHHPDQMQERLANSHAGNLDRTGPRTLIRQSRPSGHDLRLVAGVHETTFRVNVRWMTPLGEETASTS
jgi:hypothetical protein